MADNATIVLWDIDGTLIDSSGAGGSALLQAVEAEFSVTGAQSVSLHGRTDAGIFRELLRVNGVDPTDANFDRLCQRYYEALPAVLAKREAVALPGVVDLLGAMHAHEHFRLGLLTGNMPVSARMKLKHYGLDQYFSAGTFGDQARQRPGLRKHAAETARQLNGGPLAPQRVVVIGDTPLDVELAQAMEARCLAVATGGCSQLELAAAGADRTAADLCNTQDILDWCAASFTESSTRDAEGIPQRAAKT